MTGAKTFMPSQALCKTLLVAPILLLPCLAQAQPAWPDCPANYPGGMAPRAVGANAEDVTDLCYHGFAVAFSRSKAGPLSSSQFLTRERMTLAGKPAEATALHTEARVPASLQAQPSEYAVAGYAVGQLSPAADMADAASKSDSTSLANAVPQTAALHLLWAKLEQATRGLSARYDVIYVVSGPVFQKGLAQPAAGRLVVPEGVYKAIYNPEAGWAGAYVCENTASPTCEVVTLAALQAMTGLDVFPALPQSVKAAGAPLPTPPGG